MKKLLLFVTLFLTACAPVASSTMPPATATSAPVTQEGSPATTTPTDTSSSEPNPQPAPTNARIEDDKEYFVPSMLGFDAIYPVYDPIFAPANEADLNNDELVMGVAIDGQAKAYPVTVLQFREMVDDELAGLPILVTW